MSSTPTLQQRVAGALRAEMARRRLTSVDLALVLNLSQSSASRRMTGETGLDLDELDAIAAWLGVEPQSLIPRPTAA